ncbi:PREDICTED: microtubule-associated protein 1A-like isoform X2 [Amphimedon queenslandica]|uniref:Little elongation complex subunit 1 C-terminal domain-containing protein n=1 Tax=Amphimedon queenslandica TaxID=400682 RepID=A0AAN0IV28_AMPQE|nr:PREDICTED: microtubule-associated protein 1A-like isoform X2 [Amphimedon queenslandica]|eukprot:XP_011409711.1 PREDICTED: microtubule-associated protein 1A-like isoform X2 [Amphimedon queenslandica]
MTTCTTQQPWFEESCSVADDVDDLLAYSDPTPNLYSVPSNRGGTDQIESLVQLNLDLQNSLSALREEYDIVYQEKNQLLIDNKSLQEQWERFQDDRYQQKAYIEQLEAELYEKRKELASLKKESELTKENVKLKKLVRRLRQEQKYSKVTSTNSPANKKRYDWSVDDDDSLESAPKRRTQDSDTMSVIVLSPEEDPMESHSPETPFIDFEVATPLPGNGNHSSTASPMPPVSPLLSASVIDNGDSTIPTVNNGQLLATASPMASSMPLFNDTPVGSPRSSVVSVPVSQVPVPVSQISVPISPAPVPVSPAPVPVSPAPIPVSPTPVPVSPVSVPVSPVSVPVSPVSVPVSPIPVPVPPAPVPVSPVSVPVSPAPVPVSPVSVLVSPAPVPVSPTPVPVVNETLTPEKSPVSSVTSLLSPMDQSRYPLATMSPSTMSNEEEEDDDDDDYFDDYQEVLCKITSLPLLLSPLPPSPSRSPPPSLQAPFPSTSQTPLPSTSQVLLSSSSQISPSTLNPQTPSISPLLSLNRRLSSPITPLPPSPCVKAAAPSGPFSAGLPPSSCRVNLLKSFSQISESSSSVSRQCVVDEGGESNHDKIIMTNSDEDDEMGWESNCKEMLSLPSLLSPLPSTPLPPPGVPSSTMQCVNKPFSPSFSGQSESRVEKEPDLREEAEHEDSADLVIDIDPDIKFDSIESSLSQPLDPLIAPMTHSTESLMVDVVAVGYTNLPNDSPSLSETNTRHHSDSELSSTKEEIMKDVHSKKEKETVPDNATGQCISTADDLLSPTIQKAPPLPFPPPPQSFLSPAQPLPVYSQSQLELPDYMKCSHPLPHWLIYSMKQVQDKKEEMLYTASGGSAKKCVLFHSDPTKPIKKAKKKKIWNFVYESLTMLMNGSLHLSTVVLMLTNKKSVASCHYKAVVIGIIKFLRQGYHPLYAAWRGLSLEKIGQIRKGILDPLNSHYPPPLLPLETLIIALVINIQSIHPQLITELMNQLYDEIFSTSLTFHNACAMCRIYTALGRLLSGLDQIQGLVCELILQSKQLGLVESVASVWPYSLSRATGSTSPPLFVNNRLQSQGLEYQPLSFTLEALAGEGLFKKDKSTVTAMKNISAFCKWQQNLSSMIRDSLTECLIDMLKNSSSISIKVAPDSKPYPSRHACTIVLALRLLSKVRGWKEWTNDVLIRHYTWPILQQWNKEPESVREATVVCLIRLLGFVGQEGLDNSNSPSINQLQKVLLSILKKRFETAKKATLAVQIAAVDSLIELCPPTHSNYPMVHPVLFQWIQSLKESSATASIASEYSGKCKLKHHKSY